MKLNFGIIQAITLFLFIFVVPLILQFILQGIQLSGNIYFLNKSNITGLNESLDHLTSNLYQYLNILENPIFWFFFVALIVQKAMNWIINNFND